MYMYIRNVHCINFQVEDRRVEAEKKLISLQMRCETLQEKFNVEKQQNQKYKVYKIVSS